MNERTAPVDERRLHWGAGALLAGLGVAAFEGAHLNLMAPPDLDDTGRLLAALMVALPGLAMGVCAGLLLGVTSRLAEGFRPIPGPLAAAALTFVTLVGGAAAGLLAAAHQYQLISDWHRQTAPASV